MRRPPGSDPTPGRSGGAPKVMRATERVRVGGGPGHGPPGMVGQKAENFGPSLRRLVGRLRPEARKLSVVIATAVASVGLSAIGPRILGRATDLLFAGVIGARLPAGMTKAQAIAAARASGQGKIADLLSGIDLVPGRGVAFTALGHVLLLVLAISLGSVLLQFLQGYVLNDVVQGTVYRMREQVEDKLNSLPLAYFDRQPRGELLSRVTNDIDNVSQSLQQTMSQLLTSLLTIVFVVGMMISISPLLALVALITIPLT
ncbi:MAG: ABC transporter ATP-binding protein, partial [Deinococcales bacterium]